MSRQPIWVLVRAVHALLGFTVTAILWAVKSDSSHLPFPNCYRLALEVLVSRFLFIFKNLWRQPGCSQPLNCREKQTIKQPNNATEIYHKVDLVVFKCISVSSNNFREIFQAKFPKAREKTFVIGSRDHLWQSLSLHHKLGRREDCQKTGMMPEEPSYSYMSRATATFLSPWSPLSLHQTPGQIMMGPPYFPTASNSCMAVAH